MEGMARLGLSGDWAMISSSRAHLEGLASLGISVDELGIQASAHALELDEANSKRDHQEMETTAMHARAELGDLAEGFPAALAALEADHVGTRLWREDVSLWTDKPSEADEASRRLGWLTLPEAMQAEAGALKSFAEELRGEGLRHAVVLGMGGSSLAPDVFRRILHPAQGMELHVLDSTDPEMVERIAGAVSPAEALYVVSSKSGTTTEPLALLEYFWAAAQAAVGDDAGRHFAAVTDPGTSLQTLAEARRFPPRLLRAGKRGRALLGAVRLRPAPGGAAGSGRRRAVNRCSGHGAAVRRRQLRRRVTRGCTWAHPSPSQPNAGGISSRSWRTTASSLSRTGSSS